LQISTEQNTNLPGSAASSVLVIYFSTRYFAFWRRAALIINIYEKNLMITKVVRRYSFIWEININSTSTDLTGK